MIWEIFFFKDKLFDLSYAIGSTQSHQNHLTKRNGHEINENSISILKYCLSVIQSQQHLTVTLTLKQKQK